MKNPVSSGSSVTALPFAGTWRTRNAFLHAFPEKRCIFSMLVLCCCLQVAGQSRPAGKKIDPVFSSVLAARKNGSDTLIDKTLSAHSKVVPTEGMAPGSRRIEKRYDCIVYTKYPQVLRDSGIIINSVLPDFVTAWATPDQIAKMATMPEVLYIKAPSTMKVQNDVAVGSSGASLLHAGKLNNTVYKGKNVLVAIFDTGIDWDHPDFRNAADQTKSRILRIWDQTLTPVAGEASPGSFSYGVEYTQAQINDELDGTPANYVRERDINGHGTHVAGTAAGNGSALPSKKYTGMAPEADLIVIKGGDSTFSSVNVVNAISYLQGVAATLGRPIVVNMSFSFLLSAHDGTHEEEVAIDQFTASGPGRAVVVAAGNYNVSNLHNRVGLAGNASTSSSFTVPAVTGGTDVFTYKMYANSNSNITAALTAPGGGTVTAAADQNTSGSVLNNDFAVTLNNAVDIGNGNRFVEVAVARNGLNTTSAAGSWILTITNNTAASLTLDGWLDKGAGFSATALAGGDNDFLVSTPGNAASAITVTSYVSKLSAIAAVGGVVRYSSERQDSISSFSSRGPRRDGLLKPDIAAAGEGLVSCLSSDALASALGVVTNTGLYQLLQGTSMSAAVITGSVALLFQANPAATAAQVKAMLASNTDKDAFTELPGATPNTTWGYGKADVFKAASALFNCSPADRKTYQYDFSGRPSQYAFYYPISTQRLAVKFTPDISGKLGGVFFFTYPFTTGLLLEVRTSNAGQPGSLLGTLNIDSSSILKFTMNYFDISSLNISVTSATDYFIVLTRNAASSTNWGLFCDNTAPDNRSLLSTNGGTSWSTPSPNYDYVIRSVVYTNGQLAGTIAGAASTDTRDINTSNSFINNNCALIAQLVPAGASPVTGSITGNVWLETGVPHYGLDPFVSRHYQLTPALNASGATGRVTLYFTQQEFTSFNNDANSALDLPANPADAPGKANLRIGKYAGSSSDGSGLPGTYTGDPELIDPDDADIVWNAEYNRWEVSFAVNGFSGFVVQTKATTLPLAIEYFRGKKSGSGNQLSWKVNCTGAAAVCEIQRSKEGFDFDNIGRLPNTQALCQQPLGFTDVSPLPGENYYRIKITESNGTIRYTGVVLLREDALTGTVYPTVLAQNTAIQVSYTGVKGNLFITDATGRQVYTHALTGGIQSLVLPIRTSGTYFYSIQNDQGKISGGKLFIK